MDRHLELEHLGILRQTKVPADLSWASAAEKAFLLDLLLCGSEGFHKKGLKSFQKENPTSLINLEVRGLVNWVSDKAGRPTFITLSWKGEDVAKLLMAIAKNENRRAPIYQKSIAASEASKES